MKKDNGVGNTQTEEKRSASLPNKGDCQSVIYDSSVPKQYKGNVHFKILVPSIAAGAIIGKGGEAITEIQNQTLAKVKMSKANAFYPGTTERVCLIVGTIDSILRVFHYISEKIYEKPESVISVGFESKLPFERHKQVKILVPNSTAGMIIGKAGSFIKELKDNLGVFIQVSQKSKELNLAERCVTVAGELAQTRSAVAFILNKISEDPQSSSCPNICYSDLTGPVASAYPIGSPYALAVSSNSCLSSCSLNYSSSGQYRTTVPGPANSFTQPLTNYSPLSPSGVNQNPNSLFATNFSPAIAAALAAMSTMRPLSPEMRSAYGSNAGRALMGRGMTAGHQANSQHGSYPQSLLGTAGLHYGTGVSISCTTDSISSVTSSNFSLDGVRAVLKDAGYSDVATDEIANAMHVLSLYGFLSIPGLTGSANTSSLSNKAGSSHLPMVNNALSNLNRSLSSYGSGNHTFSNNFVTNDFQVRGYRNPNPVMLSNQTSNEYHNQSFTNRRSSFSSSQPLLLTTQTRTVNSNPVTTVNKDSTTSTEVKSQDALCITSYNSNICRTVDSHDLEMNIGLYSKLSTHSPIICSTSTQVPGLTNEQNTVDPDVPGKSNLRICSDDDEHRNTDGNDDDDNNNGNNNGSIGDANDDVPSPTENGYHLNNNTGKQLIHPMDDAQIKEEAIVSDGISCTGVVGVISSTVGDFEKETGLAHDIWHI